MKKFFLALTLIALMFGSAQAVPDGRMPASEITH